MLLLPLAEKRPGAHGEHAEGGEVNVPGGQLSAHEAASEADTRPAGQARQLELLKSAKRPAEHAVQAVEPADPATKPGAQGTQELKLVPPRDGFTVPTGQGTGQSTDGPGQ